MNVDNAVKKITGGAGHSIILTDKGKVYSCGLNNRGQAGAPEGIKYLTKFEKILELEDEVIVDVACGWDSSIAINTRGDLFAWGSNAFGQLGVDSPNALYTPTKVNDTLDPIIKIAMGLRHSVLVTDRGNVLVSGDGTKCQLGLTGEKCAGKNARAFTEGHFSFFNSMMRKINMNVSAIIIILYRSPRIIWDKECRLWAKSYYGTDK